MASELTPAQAIELRNAIQETRDLMDSLSKSSAEHLKSLEAALNLSIKLKTASGEIKTAKDAELLIEQKKSESLKQALSSMISQQKAAGQQTRQLQAQSIAMANKAASLTKSAKSTKKLIDLSVLEKKVIENKFKTDADRVAARKDLRDLQKGLTVKEKEAVQILRRKRGVDKQLTESRSKQQKIGKALAKDAGKMGDAIAKSEKSQRLLNAGLQGTKGIAGNIAGLLGIQKTDLSETLDSIFSPLEDIEKKFNIVDALKQTKANLAELITPGTVLASTFDKVFQSTYKMVTEANEAFTSMTRSTGQSSEAHEKLVTTTFYGNLAMGQSIGEVAEAYSALHSSLADFSNQTTATQKRLTEAAMIYKNLGVSGTSFATALTNVTKSAGMSDGALARMTKTANNMGFNTEQAFNMLNENAELFFQYSGPQLEKEFANMSALSKKLGIDVRTIASAMKQFDTFEGAANSVGRLNAMLRGPYFNTLEMLRATESERVQLLQRGLQESGKSWGTMNRFQQKYIAEQAGLNVVDMGKIMRGEDTMAEMTARNQAFNSTMDDLKKMAITATPIIKKFTNIMARLAIPFEWIIDVLDWITTSAAETKEGMLLLGVGVAAIIFPFNRIAAVIQLAAAGIIWLNEKLHERKSPPFYQIFDYIADSLTNLVKVVGTIVGVIVGGSGLANAIGFVGGKFSSMAKTVWGGMKAFKNWGSGFKSIIGDSSISRLSRFKFALTDPFNALKGSIKGTKAVGPALKNMTASTTAAGNTASRSTPKLLQLAAVLAAIGIAAGGLGYFVSVVKELNDQNLVALAVTLAIFGVAVRGFMVMMDKFKRVAIKAAIGIVALGAGMLLLALSLKLMEGTLVDTAWAWLGLAAFSGAMALWGIPAGIGVAAFGAGLLVFAVGLGAVALVGKGAINALSRFVEALSKIDYGKAGPLISSLSDMGTSLDDIDEDAAEALMLMIKGLDGTNVNLVGLDSLINLASAGVSTELFLIAEALSQIASAGFFLAFTSFGFDAMVDSLQEIPVEKAMALSTVLETTTAAASDNVDTTSLAKDMEKMAAATYIMEFALDKKAKKQQEGVLVTDKIVVDLGGGKKLEKRVLDIVNKKLGSKI